MKRSLVILLITVLALIVITAGCASKSSSSSSNNSAVINPASSSATSSTNSTTKVFTLAELKKYNGKNGSPAYVAVDGKVYDVTNAKGWNNGQHAGYSAGTDLTSFMNQSPHGTSVLTGLTIVGTLK